MHYLYNALINIIIIIIINFLMVNANVFLCSALHNTSFLCDKIHFGVLYVLRASITTFDTTPSSDSNSVLYVERSLRYWIALFVNFDAIRYGDTIVHIFALDSRHYDFWITSLAQIERENVHIGCSTVFA